MIKLDVKDIAYIAIAILILCIFLKYILFIGLGFYCFNLFEATEGFKKFSQNSFSDAFTMSINKIKNIF